MSKPDDDKKNKENANKKQGEEGKITKTTDDGKGKDFKGSGVEGEKGDEGLQEENARLKEDNANLQADASRLKNENAELKAEKSEIKEEEKKPEEEKEKTYVSGEDVIKKMRAEGKKI